MPESPTQRLISLNDQAIAILRLGIPLDLGLGANCERQLRQINDILQFESDSDHTIETLLARQSLPERYVSVARMMLATDDPAPIFESIASQQLARDAASNPFRQAVIEPFVIAGLGYLGLIFLCSYTLPHLEYQYTQQGQVPSGVTKFLMTIRDAMPIWIVAFPILMIVIWLVWGKFVKQGLMNHIPGSGPYGRWLVAESQAKRLSAMVDSGVDQDTALSLATTSVTPHTPVRPIAESIVRSGNGESRRRALNRLARFYHFLAEDRRQTYFNKAPALIGMFFAAVVVFGYALATFVPWIEVLSNLSGLGSMQQ
ncbi:MAG: hypothetical protein KDB00_30130 [Planctomycetales bacterium]|nr:hypothetical protein [Planctomycetales bacterium]